MMVGGFRPQGSGTPVGLPLAAGFTVVVMATALASLVFSQGDLAGRVLIMAMAVAGFALSGVRIGASLGTGVIAWMFTTGFLVNDAGELSLSTDDAARLVLFVVTALGGTAVAAMLRPREGPTHRLRGVPGPSGVTLPAQGVDGAAASARRPVSAGTARSMTEGKPIRKGEAGDMARSGTQISGTQTSGMRMEISDLAEARVRMQGLSRVPPLRRARDMPASAVNPKVPSPRARRRS
ncbi:hypothetical protein SAMN05421505_11987 [Sinosporangium album]|uniref:Uncharacterized protein n=2 Tax=Sinosporangium album TaxID=504805 RepID=A0A1G8E2H2_9ACTN|nr:hypothetical protein SAMN05421505_11987 [Sinosporangium album]